MARLPADALRPKDRVAPRLPASFARVFYPAMAAIVASILATVMQREIHGWTAAWQARELLAANISRTFDATAAAIGSWLTLEPMIGFAVLTVWIRRPPKPRSPLVSGLLLGTLCLVIRGELIRQPVLYALVHVPALVIAVNAVQMWLPWLVGGVAVAIIVQGIPHRDMWKPDQRSAGTAFKGRGSPGK